MAEQSLKEKYTVIKHYAPVVIPTLNRYEHFKRCIESLERCSGADKTDVYVGLDFPPSEKYVEGWKMIDDYLTNKEAKHGFSSLIVYRRKYNCGVGKKGSNAALLIDELSTKYDSYIFSEDDNEFSPSFLEYMNNAFLKYKDNPRIIRISGYKSPVLRAPLRENVFCNIDSPAYGFGHWIAKDRDLNVSYNIIEKELKSSLARLLKNYWIYPAIIYKAIRMIEKKANYGDVTISVLNLINGSFTLCPSVSLVRNWGCDGSGFHCGFIKNLHEELISNNLHFEIDEIKIELSDDIRKTLRYLNMPHGRINYYLHLIYYLLVTIRFYFKK